MCVFICVMRFVLFYLGMIHFVFYVLLLYCVLGLCFEEEPKSGWACRRRSHGLVKEKNMNKIYLILKTVLFNKTFLCIMEYNKLRMGRISCLLSVFCKHQLSQVLLSCDIFNFPLILERKSRTWKAATVWKTWSRLRGPQLKRQSLHHSPLLGAQRW